MLFALFLLLFVPVCTAIGVVDSARAGSGLAVVGADAQSPPDWAALHSAASAGNAELVQSLLATNAAALVYKYDGGNDDNEYLIAQNGTSALHIAAAKGYTEVVRLLIDGALQNDEAEFMFWRDASGKTALHVAALNGNTETVSVLLEGLRWQVEDWVGYRDGNIEQRWTALHMAAYMNRAEVAHVLLEAGAQLEAMGAKGDTALHVAAAGGNAETVRVLLAAGAELENTLVDPDNEDFKRWTALHLAAYLNRAEVAHVLLEAGAQLEAVCTQGRTALHAAAAGGSAETVRVLLAAGARLEAEDHHGVTALHFAIVNTHAAVAHTLLSANAQLPAVGFLGKVTLHVAVLLGQIDGLALKSFWSFFVAKEGFWTGDDVITELLLGLLLNSAWLCMAFSGQYDVPSSVLRLLGVRLHVLILRYIIERVNVFDPDVFAKVMAESFPLTLFWSLVVLPCVVVIAPNHQHVGKFIWCSLWGLFLGGELVYLGMVRNDKELSVRTLLARAFLCGLFDVFRIAAGLPAVFLFRWLRRLYMAKPQQHLQ